MGSILDTALHITVLLYGLYVGVITTWLHHWHDQTAGSHWHDQVELNWVL
jgi:hypothetical protein